MINDRDINLRWAPAYLKRCSTTLTVRRPMAAAAYNAGPGRPRRWREGPLLEPAAWAENIPFNETRDYVKKVLSNASTTRPCSAARAAALAEGPPGPPIGPRDPARPVAELP
jgi:soluble lytic murein transglycosylase